MLECNQDIPDTGEKPSFPKSADVCASPLLYAGAKDSVVDRWSINVQLTRKYLDFNGTAEAFIEELKQTPHELERIPTAKTIRSLAKKAKGAGGFGALMPKKPGPKKPTKMTDEVLEILLSLMAGTYPTTGSKKKPRKRPVSGCVEDLEEKCKQQGIEEIPSKRTLQRGYQKVPDVEKEAPKKTMRELDAAFGTRSVNSPLKGCHIQMDHVAFDYTSFERDGKKIKLQLCVGIEKSTGFILSPTWFEGSMNVEKLRAVLFNLLTTDSDPGSPSLIPADVIELDGESPHRSLKKKETKIEPIGAIFRIGPPKKAWQRGLSENRNKHASQNLFPDLEVEIREFISRNRSHVVTEAKREAVYAHIKEKVAKVIHAHNTKIRRDNGKSRLEMFREKFDSKRLPVDLLGARFFCKEQYCTAKAIGQVQVSLADGNKTHVYHPEVVQGTKYRVLSLRGAAGEYFLFQMDGTPIGRGEILRPGTKAALTAHTASQKILGEIKRKSDRRRIEGGKIRLQNTAEKPFPKEGMREILLDQPKCQKSPRKSAECNSKTKALEKESASIAVQALPEPVPAPKKYTRMNFRPF